MNTRIAQLSAWYQPRDVRRHTKWWCVGIALAIGAGALFTAHLFIEAHSVHMTRGRKREVVSELLPVVAPVLAVLAGAGLSLAIARLGSLSAVLCGDPRHRARVVERVFRIVATALIIALLTPLLQGLVGLPSEITASRLFETPARAVMSTAGLFSSAIQEDVLVRWLPLELVLLGGLRGRSRTAKRVVVIALLVSTLLATFGHALHGSDLPSLEMLYVYGVPKAPVALALAWLYVRFGVVEAWLTHACSNAAILLLLPEVV